MSWNYRVMKREISEGEFEYGIYEVYYNENGKVISYIKDSLTPTCDSADALKYKLQNRMMKAFDEDTLTYTEDA